MNLTDGNKDEVKAYEHMYLEDLAVQDALVILAVYASQLDLQGDNRDDIRRIETILERCPACILKKEGIFSRIHKYVNAMRTMDPLAAAKKAAETLAPSHRETAFELATQAASRDVDFTDDRKRALDAIAGMLGIDS